MKLSLSWIFDHIKGDYKTVDVAQLVDKFNHTTAAIEHFYSFELPINELTVVVIKKITDENITVFSPELTQQFILPARPDAILKQWYVVRVSLTGAVWATLGDFGSSSKTGLMPAVHCAKRDQRGAWKKTIETHDVIFELDNPSITHRADLWAIRGIARECAAILNLKLKPLSAFLGSISVQEVEHEYRAHDNTQWTVLNQAPQACPRFSALYFSAINAAPCSLRIAARLCRTDHKPINFWVDSTNYVMLDLGQPLHAFDAAKVGTHCLAPRMARDGEKLQLLDGAQLTLTDKDLVITDGTRLLSLAGIMGGSDTGVDASTTALVLESANFNSSVIRLSASHHHLRTEASARFEKGQDPNQITDAIKRLLKLCAQEKIKYQLSGPLMVIGKSFEPYTIVVPHNMIEQKLGLAVSGKHVCSILRTIGFAVSVHKKQYHVIVPTFRGTKNVTIPEDIVEEVARFVGWDKIPYVMPQWSMAAHDVQPIMCMRELKKQLAFGLHMHEVQNYPFFDESFLRELKWEPTHAIDAKNPLSLNVTRLVTSLVPHLFKNIQQNMNASEVLRFFETNRIWHVNEKKQPVEQKMLAGVMWDVQGKIDFYTAKTQLDSLFCALGLTVTWEKVDAQPAVWYHAHQTAQLLLDGTVVGYAGMVDTAFFGLVSGNGFVFECATDPLVNHKNAIIRFKPLPKYPYVYFDISMLMPLARTVQEIEQHIRAVDEHIYDVALVDMFFKDEWGDKRSLTFRYYMRNPERTLTSADAEAIGARVIQAMNQLGAQIR